MIAAFYTFMESSSPNANQAALEATYTALKRARSSWWHIFSQEQLLLKTILAAFLLYVGYVVVSFTQSDTLLLFYTILTVAVGWYWLNVLQVQYAKHRQHYQQKIQGLNKEFGTWVKSEVVAAHPELTLAAAQIPQLAKTHIPYIWGLSMEAVREGATYYYEDILISSIRVEQEQLSRWYWLLSVPYEQVFPTESTAFLPKPYAHDKWQAIQFNAQIQLPDFKANYSIYSSEFMHSYHLVSAAKVRQFMQLPETDKWLLFKNEKAYLLIPKEEVVLDVGQLATVVQQAKKQAAAVIATARSFQQLLD